MKKKLLRGVGTLSALAFWVLLWHLVSVKVDLSFILPGPGEVFPRFFQLALSANFYEILALSFLRIMSGFLCGALLGILLGTLAHYSVLLRTLFAPLMAFVRATPVASFILVVILFLEKNEVPGFISLLMVLPILFQNTLLGFESKDRELHELATVYRFGFWKRFLRLELPQVLPFLRSGAATAIGLAWKAGVAAEVLSLPKVSIGMMIYQAKQYLETTDLYAWTLAIILFSVLVEKLLIGFLKKARWSE